MCVCLFTATTYFSAKYSVSLYLSTYKALVWPQKRGGESPEKKEMSTFMYHLIFIEHLLCEGPDLLS